MPKRKTKRRTRLTGPAKRRLGRPKGAERLKTITFKAGPKTLHALERLMRDLAASLGPDAVLVNGGRSQAIRKAIREAAARLDAADGTAQLVDNGGGK